VRTDEYYIPADACANPMHGLIAGPPTGGPLALHIKSEDRMLHLSRIVLY